MIGVLGEEMRMRLLGEILVLFLLNTIQPGVQ
jgi:hypothetical protein